MKIGIASDHRGFNLKQEVTKILKSQGYNIIDYGTNSIESVDYPDYSLKLGLAIKNKEIDYGIIICGTGIGVSIACNKIKGVRCAKVNTLEEIKLSRLHNDANVLAIYEKMDIETAINFIKIFVETDFSNEARHLRRLEKIKKIEEAEYER